MRRATAAVMVSMLAVASGALAAEVPAGATPPPGPQITTGQDPTGTSFMVTGTGWTPNTLINLEVCGNEALGGSADCDVANSQVVGANAKGEFVGLLPIAVPPAQCPCIVRAMSQTYTEIATAPIAVPGAVTEAPGDRDVGTPLLRQLSFDAVSLTGSGPWTAWFGGSPERTLKLTVVNTGEVPVDEAMVNLWVGEGDDPSGFVPPIRVDRLEPGESASYEVEIELGALTFGEQTVAGEIRGIGEPTSFATTTTSYPWLLIIVPIVVVVQLILVASRNRLRRRLHATEAAAAAAAADAGAADTEPTAEEGDEPGAGEEGVPDEEPAQDEPAPVAEDAPVDEEPGADEAPADADETATDETASDDTAAGDGRPELAEAARISRLPAPPPPVFAPPTVEPLVPPPPPAAAGGAVVARPAPPPLPSRTKPLQPVAARGHLFSRLDRR